MNIIIATVTGTTWKDWKHGSDTNPISFMHSLWGWNTIESCLNPNFIAAIQYIVSRRQIVVTSSIIDKSRICACHCRRWKRCSSIYWWRCGKNYASTCNCGATEIISFKNNFNVWIVLRMWWIYHLYLVSNFHYNFNFYWICANRYEFHNLNITITCIEKILIRYRGHSVGGKTTRARSCN